MKKLTKIVTISAVTLGLGAVGVTTPILFADSIVAQAATYSHFPSMDPNTPIGDKSKNQSTEMGKLEFEAQNAGIDVAAFDDAAAYLTSASRDFSTNQNADTWSTYIKAYNIKAAAANELVDALNGSSQTDPTEPTTIAATGVTITNGNATLKVGETKQLTAAVTPSDATNTGVTWSSSNPAVATVNGSGVVSAVAAGTATINVTTTDGNFTAGVTITVASTQTTTDPGNTTTDSGAKPDNGGVKPGDQTTPTNKDNSTTKTATEKPATAKTDAKATVKASEAKAAKADTSKDSNRKTVKAPVNTAGENQVNIGTVIASMAAGSLILATGSMIWYKKRSAK